MAAGRNSCIARVGLCGRYALSQTTLEQIFNLFASQQEEEKGAVRGMRAVA